MSVSVLILTKNEAQDLPGCLESVKWCDDIHVFDSFSTDNTVTLAQAAGATVTQRAFDNWSSHQNWGLANIPFKHPWVFYLDADERVSMTLREDLRSARLDSTPHAAFEVRRRDFGATGVWLKHAQISPYYVRLFRPGSIHYERLVNPVSKVRGTIGRRTGYLDHYPFSKGTRFWIQRHLGYADFEAQTRMADLEGRTKFSLVTALTSRDFTERRYHQKGIFYKIPGRPILKWLYMIVWRRAFLDGTAGITYATLQSVYEYFIVLKEREISRQGRERKAREANGQPPSVAANKPVG